MLVGCSFGSADTDSMVIHHLYHKGFSFGWFFVVVVAGFNLIIIPFHILVLFIV